jgi:hypothetical protein
MSVLDFLRLLAKAFDKDMPDAKTLFLRIVDVLQDLQKTLFRMDDVQVRMKMVGKLINNGLRFVQPQQSIVDEDTGELITNGLLE